jgi:hypothetical protein
MTREVRPVPPDSNVVKGCEGRYVDQEEQRIFHQDAKVPSRRGRIYDGICADSCVIQDPWTSRAGPYMAMPPAARYDLTACSLVAASMMPRRRISTSLE